jgi:hypothetical protein
LAQDKSHKQQNTLHLCALAGVHVAGFLAATGLLTNIVGPTGDLSKLGAAPFVAAATALFVLMINAQASDVLKARVVFLKWRDPLPGSEAFSRWMHAHPDIDPEAVQAAVGVLPKAGTEQNRAWRCLYHAMETHPAISDASRDYLLARDTTFLGLIFSMVFGAAVWFFPSAVEWKATYAVLAAGFTLLTWRAARLNGIRLVRMVLARVPRPRLPHA